MRICSNDTPSAIDLQIPVFALGFLVNDDIARVSFSTYWTSRAYKSSAFSIFCFRYLPVLAQRTHWSLNCLLVVIWVNKRPSWPKAFRKVSLLFIFLCLSCLSYFRGLGTVCKHRSKRSSHHPL